EPPADHVGFHFDGVRQVADLRAFTHRLAGLAGLPADRIDSLLICVDEAAANAIRHGGGAGECRMWTTAAEVFCEITEPKGTFDTALAGYLPPDTSHVDGRGLWIIRQLSDAVDVRATEHGTIVRMHMSRRR
ncbi:ATP-binding protein, partial [Streptomyces sp. NPDC052196]|uniref:ATP-binding protein n=1 Tax=Streptomyces sp. NPDC052196 TaxID=3156691 RepID=UPI003433D07B